MHVHVVNSQLPGAKADQTRLAKPPEETAAWLGREMEAAGVEQVLAMGCLAVSQEDPLGVRSTQAVADCLPGIHAIGIADPANITPAHLARVEDELGAGRVKALKGYSGYVYFGPDSPEYAPYYRLAAKYGLPFIFHTGDTYSVRAKVKYAHPLRLDEAAVDNPDVQFVMAHFGNPWLADAAEVVYKNENVWADLSGLLVGDDAAFDDMARRGALDEVAADVRRAMRYAERPDRFLYGSDWPLAPMRRYREFAERIVPAEHREAVFHENARRLFRL